MTSASSASGTSTDAVRRTRAVAFGRNYFHAVGGTQKEVDIDEEGSAVELYQWEQPPWNGENIDDQRITQVACSSQSTLFLTATGKVYQTGTLHGVVYKTPVPVTIPIPRKCVEIAAGRHFCLGRMEGGLAVVSWGAGHFGQLGLGHAEGNSQITFTPYPIVMQRLLPRVIGSPVLQVACGSWHGLALSASGRVWAWGSNRTQQCGRKPTLTAGSNHAPTVLVPLPVPLEVMATQIAAGRSHSVAIARDQVYCWGSTAHGQCGNSARRGGVTAPRLVEGLANLTVEHVAANGNHTLALTNGGRVFAWGSNAEGQLGTGPACAAQPKPRHVGDVDFVAIEAGKEWKANKFAEVSASALSSVPRIASVYAGASYSAAVSTSGHVYTWGSNDVGQAGLATPLHVPMKENPIHVATAKTSTIRDLNVATFDSRHDVLLPQRVDAARNLFVRNVACGPNHMWCIGEERTTFETEMMVGTTLYKAQEERRKRSLQRARNALQGRSSPIHYATMGEDDTKMATVTEDKTLTFICSEMAALPVENLTLLSESANVVDPPLPKATLGDGKMDALVVKDAVNASTSTITTTPAETLSPKSAIAEISASNAPKEEQTNGMAAAQLPTRRPNMMKRLSWHVRKKLGGNSRKSLHGF